MLSALRPRLELVAWLLLGFVALCAFGGVTRLIGWFWAVGLLVVVMLVVAAWFSTRER